MKKLYNETALRNNIDELLERSLLIKKKYIEEDEFDKGIRNILNFGHCIGHAIESVTSYSMPHGQAVTLGIIWANIISEKRNILSNINRNKIYNTLLKPIYTIPKNLIPLNPKMIISAMEKDKKRVGADLAIILMDNDYKFKKYMDLKQKEILETFDDFISLL
jgi:3-dehydroquinate synthase